MPATVEYSTIGHHRVAVAAEHEGGDVLDADAEFLGEEMAEARAVEHAGHADHHVVRQARRIRAAPRPSRRAGW